MLGQLHRYMCCQVAGQSVSVMVCVGKAENGSMPHTLARLILTVLPRPAPCHHPCVGVVCVQSHRGLCEGVSALARRVQGDRELTNLIRRKFAIKCTTGGAERVLYSGCMHVQGAASVHFNPVSPLVGSCQDA